MIMVARALQPADSAFGPSSGELGAPPGTAGARDPGEESEGVAPGRLFLGMAGFAVLALHDVVAMAVGVPTGQLPWLLFCMVHALGLGLGAAGFSGLRTPAGVVAGAVAGVAGLVVLCMPLLHVLDVQSLTAAQLSDVVMRAALTLSCVTSAAVGVASAERLGVIRGLVAALWSLASIPAARFLYASVMSLLRDPLNPADDKLWSQLAFGFGGLAAATTAVAFIVAKLKAESTEAS